MAKGTKRSGLFESFKFNIRDDEDEFDDDLFDDDEDDFDDDDSYSRTSKPRPVSSISGRDTQRSNSGSKGVKSYKDAPTRTTSKSSSKLVDFDSRRPVAPTVNARGDVYVIRPNNVEDTNKIVDYLLDGFAVVINLEGVDLSTAQRIIDFVGGATTAISGSIRAISGNMFIAASHDIDISGDLRQEYVEETSMSPFLG